MQGIVFQDRQICGTQFSWAEDCKNSQNYNWAPRSIAIFTARPTLVFHLIYVFDNFAGSDLVSYHVKLSILFNSIVCSIM